MLGTLVGALVVAIPILDLSKTNYKFALSPELVIFALVLAVPGMAVGLVVGLICGAVMQSFGKRRARSQ
jgi:hypothetical protein